MKKLAVTVHSGCLFSL